MLIETPPLNLNIEVKNPNWSEFLKNCDLHWHDLKYIGGHFNNQHNRPFRDWANSAFLGNGMMGACIFKRSYQSIGWELGRSDVEAQNYITGVDWGRSRVPIGDFILSARGMIQSEEMHLCLYDAEAKGEMRTEKGEIRWRSLIHASDDLLIVELTSSGGELHPQIEFIPSHGISPRLACVPEDKVPNNLILPPKPRLESENDILLSIQTFVNDSGELHGECAVAWKLVEISDSHSILYCSIKNAFEIGAARKEAIKTVKTHCRYDVRQIELSHREWWHSYYPQSFISISDKYWEKFYWVQMYKLASATRSNVNVAIDNQGPWLTRTGWPCATWNLNVQLAYSPLYKANRLNISGSLLQALHVNKEQLRQNALPLGIEDGAFMRRGAGVMLVSKAPMYADIFDDKKEVHFFEIGNLTWALFNIWIEYRSTMNQQLLKEKLFPLMRANMNVYLRLLQRGDDGKWHLPKTTSPEYPGPNSSDSYPAYDVNYSLGSLRWLCGALIEINEELHLKDPALNKWTDVLENLADYPCDENGLMVAKDVPFKVSHRHYSHLMAFYPLHLLNVDQPGERSLAEKSFKHWISLDKHLKGYSFTGASCMASTLGDGELALKYLDGLKPYLLSNTMYLEGGGPVIETPLAAAESIHYMLLQCWGDTIRVFPAIPGSWQDISFRNLLAEGGFEISGERSRGKNLWVRIKSLAGRPLKIQLNLSSPMVHGSIRPECCDIDVRTIGVKLGKGESVTFYSTEK